MFACGCIVRPAAETVITVKKENDPDFGKRKMGLKKVFWIVSEYQIEVAGHGFHPKESQIYVFFWRETNPIFQPRDIHIKFKREKFQAKNQCEIGLLLDSSLVQNIENNEPAEVSPQISYAGSAKCKPEILLGKMYIDLKDVKLARQDGIDENLIVSGKIVAKKTDKLKFAEEKILFRFKGTRYVDTTEKPDLVSEIITVYKNGTYQWDYCFPGYSNFGGKLEGNLPRPIVEQLLRATKEYRNNFLNITTPFYCFKKEGNVLTLNYDCCNSLYMYPPAVVELMSFFKEELLTERKPN